MCADHGEVSPAVSDWCEASQAALTSLTERALAGRMEYAPIAAPDAHQNAADGAELLRSPAAGEAESHARRVAQHLLAHRTGGQRLADAVAAEACASAVADVLGTAAAGTQRKNPYHEILAGGLH